MFSHKIYAMRISRVCALQLTLPKTQSGVKVYIGGGCAIYFHSDQNRCLKSMCVYARTHKSLVRKMAYFTICFICNIV